VSLSILAAATMVGNLTMAFTKPALTQHGMTHLQLICTKWGIPS
jgi:hypothetical protein